jgi:hypothetical protein
MKTFFGFGRMRALATLLCGVFVFLTLGSCASTSKVYKRGSASANGETIGTVETDLFLHDPVIYQSEVDKLLDKAHKELLTEAQKQYQGNIDVDDIVFGERQFLLRFMTREGYRQKIKLTGNVFFTKSSPSVAAPSQSTGATAIPVQATQPAAPLVQLPLEKIFVGGNPPQGTQDDYAAVLPTLNDALDWLDIYTRDGGNYAIVLGSDQTVGSGRLSYGDKRVTITLTASGGGRTVKDYFTVGEGVTFMLEKGVTISSGGGNHIVRVSGTFIMNGGTLRDSTYNNAVYVSNGGSFTMNDGTISGNKSGVYVYDGTFTMKGGTISGNKSGGVDVGESGKGVAPIMGTFTMTGGTISGNKGPGVYAAAGTFTMTGGTISGNENSGVYVRGGTFTMTGGTISENTANYGGGVYVSNGTFTMSGGTISRNSAEIYSTNTSGYVGNGGGVYVGDSGTFTMNGGIISGNTANGNTYRGGGGGDGGGVCVSGGPYPGTFTKSGTGGIIYGSNAPAGLANKAKSEAGGHAVYVSSGRSQKRTTTAGETTALDSTKNLVQGRGWE